MGSAEQIYRTLPADDRQEVRLPRLLKDHLQRAAAQAGKTLSEYVTAVLAERVSQDLGAAVELPLSIDEQASLLKILAAGPQTPSNAFRAARERADALFGPLPGSRKR